MATENNCDKMLHVASMRQAAHEVTMAVANKPHFHFYKEDGAQCAYCGRSWTEEGKIQRLGPQNHPRRCVWRIAKAYAEDVKG